MRSLPVVLAALITAFTGAPITGLAGTAAPATAAFWPATAALSPATAPFWPGAAALSPATAALSPATAAFWPATAAISPATEAFWPATTALSPATASFWPGAAAFSRACSPAASATYRHSFDGAGGTMTVTAKEPLCAGQRQSFALVSYTVSPAGSFIYDRSTDTITATNRSLTLDVDVPGCSAQVAGLFGTDIRNEVFGGDPYGDARPGSPGSRSSGPLTWYSGGGPGCTPAGTVTFVSACDGTYTARLANPGGNVTAVFTIGARLVKVAAGRTTTLRGAAGTTMTIRSSSFTTYVGGWRKPATGCTTATPSSALPTTALAAPAPLPPSSAAPSFPALVEPTAPAGEAAAPFPAPATVATSAVAAARPDKGMSSGAIIAIGIGLLMMAGGAVALTYLIREIRRPT